MKPAVRKLTQHIAMIILLVIFIVLGIVGYQFMHKNDGIRVKVGDTVYNVGDFFKDPQVRKLAIAAARGDVKTMNELVKQGVDVNYIGEQDCTPLMWTVVLRNYKGMEALLQHGANPNFVEHDGMSVMSLLGPGNYPALLELVLKHGGNPNIRDPSVDASGNNETVLNMAAEVGKIENIKLLLKYGANIEGKDGDGMTPLLYAVFCRQYKTAYFLLEQGANYKITANFPGTLHTPTNISDLIGISLRPGVSDEQQPWREKVIEWLEAHGVPRPKPAAY